MRKTLKVLLAAAAIIMALVAVTVALNRDKIVILIDAFTNKYTEEDIINLENESYGVLKGAAENTLEIEINELTDEEKEALEKGEITEEDARKIVLGEKEYVEGRVVDKEQKPQIPADYVDKSADIISQIYVLEATYKSKLKNIEHNMLVTYNQLPASDKTTVNKYKLANDAISQGNALKAECDAKMESLLLQLEKNLKEGGKDTSIVSEIRKVYTNEKNTVQSYYISKYSNR